MFFVGHVQGFIDTVIEKGIILYRLFQRGAVQQVGMEQQRPARQHHPFAVVLFSADLSGGDANDRSFLVVVLPTTVCQVYLRFVMKEYAIDAVIVQAMTYRGHFRVVNDTDQRMPVGMPHPPAIIAHVSDLQNFVHSILYDSFLTNAKIHYFNHLAECQE